MSDPVIIQILSLIGAAGAGLATVVSFLYFKNEKLVKERLQDSEKRHDECETDRKIQSEKIEKQEEKISDLEKIVLEARNFPCGKEDCPKKAISHF